MGYAFDSTSNFNATWSNSYASAVLAPGNGVAAGFARAADKRYFEFVVDANADVGYLWLGVLWRTGTMQNGWLLGGGSEVGTTAGGIIEGKSAGLTSITAEAGDVFGFAVNYSTDGIGGLSSLTYAGAGIIEVSKNGVFTGHRAVFPASGLYVAGARPLIIQEAGTSTSAVVTLRVDSLSYSYLPTGYSEWGASGGTTVVGPSAYVWEWIATDKGADYTITGTVCATGNVMAAPAGVISAGVTTQVVKTNALPTTYKVQFEIVGRYSNSHSNVYVGFIAEGRTTISAAIENPAYGTYTYSGRVLNVWFPTSDASVVEGVSGTGQTRLVGNGANPNVEKTIGGWYDPTKGLIGLYGSSGFQTSLSSGQVLVTIDNARPMFSLTSSTSLYAFLHIPFATTVDGSNEHFLANGGWKRMLYPLNPGWYSADLTRYVSTGGCSWVQPSTMTGNQAIMNGVVAGIASGTGADAKAVRASVAHSSGKKYFELYHNVGSPGVGVSYLSGLTANDTISFVSGSEALCIAQSKVAWVLGNGGQVTTYRDGTTLSAAAALSPSIVSQWRPCIAVDFAAGKVWFGYSSAIRTRTWYNGDPAAGTGGITFTASTTLYPIIGIPLGGMVVTAAFQDDAFLYDPPTGFEAWDAGSPGTVTTTATVTPSFTGSASGTNSPGGSGTRKWPFGFRP